MDIELKNEKANASIRPTEDHPVYQYLSMSVDHDGGSIYKLTVALKGPRTTLSVVQSAITQVLTRTEVLRGPGAE